MGAPVAHAAQAATPQKFPQSSVRPADENDPLEHVKCLPLDLQMMLCALANGDAMRLPDICTRYKDVCRRLRQPEHLVSNGWVVRALNALVDRGLLSLRAARRAASAGPVICGRGRGRVSAQCVSDFMPELGVPCKKLRESIKAANPLLE